MLTISKPLSASPARTYHAREFASQEQNYWSRDQRGHTEWQGTLAKQWKLTGAVEAEHFARLSEGQHPHTEEQLVRHQVSRTYEGKFGREVTSAEHRAGWDATFSAPKSVSLTALVGGDDRVREAHRESVRAALQELERYTQARIGNVHAPETTGKFIAATFEHDTARPVDGYAAPQLHTHAVIFNMTEPESSPENGKQMRALHPHEMFVSQRYVTAVYRSELALRLEKLRYELERGKHGQPEVKGYTKEYLEASSPRREQIKDHLREQGIDGAAAAQIAAHHTRDRKELLSPREVLQRHRELAAQYGHQADRVVALARQHGQYQISEPEVQAKQAVTWARGHVFERSVVQDRRAILETALVRCMGETTYAQVRQEFERRIEAGEFREVSHIGAGQQYTTAVMVRMEHEIVRRMQEGNRRDYSDPMLVSPEVRIATEDRHPELNASQREAVDEIFLSREKFVGLDGIAGAGKTTTLSVIREGAEAEGYRVEGFAPTSRAAQKLGEAGMETSTLQKHLVRGPQPDTGEKLLYAVRRFQRSNSDWSSFADKVAIQMNDTHPSLAVPELMRILVDQVHLGWDEAWHITQNTLAYTNHTLLPEALEKWPVAWFEEMLPRQLEIIYEINRRFLGDVRGSFPGDQERIQLVSVIEEGDGRAKKVRMANLAVVGSHSTNGVAEIHSKLLRETTLKDLAEIFPERFNNKTNGVTPRRWLQLCNPGLSGLITDAIGDAWIRDLSELSKLKAFTEDNGFRDDFRKAKRNAKRQFCDWLRWSTGQTVDPESIFDCQVKRIHEYKRQLLNALRIVVLYNRLRQDPGLDMHPRTFLFAGKAAPAYWLAKVIIKFINNLAVTIDGDPAVRGRLKVIFLPEYCVSLAEHLIPGSDVSNQISTAGYEASGTSNMKFMMNGALTIGTRDGATIEMAAEAGEENFFLFGLTADQAIGSRGWYNPHWHYEHESETREALDLIFADYFSRDEPAVFEQLREMLLTHGDHYMHLADLKSYLEADERLCALYADRDEWARKAILNVASSGKFSSDRTITEYAEDIWNVKPCPIPEKA